MKYANIMCISTESSNLICRSNIRHNDFRHIIKPWDFFRAAKPSGQYHNPAKIIRIIQTALFSRKPALIRCPQPAKPRQAYLPAGE